MAEEKIVPTGPQGAVRATDDGSKPVRFAGENQSARDNTPTVKADQDKKDSDVPKFGGGGQKIRMERDYWPKEQPDNQKLAQEAKGEGRAHVHQENRIRAGEVAEIPSDEAMDLIEDGHAKRVKD